MSLQNVKLDTGYTDLEFEQGKKEKAGSGGGRARDSRSSSPCTRTSKGAWAT